MLTDSKRLLGLAVLLGLLVGACRPLPGRASPAAAVTPTIVRPPTAAPATPPPTEVGEQRPAPPALGAFDPATVAQIDVQAYPVIPEISPAMRALYAAGLARGNDPHVFSKLGDCMTENAYFLVTFSEGRYDLGPYADLQPVVAQFPDALAAVSQAAAQGFNVASVLDATWANPKVCQAGESPVACEYRTARPSVAVIMFGTNDVTYTDPDAYNFYLRTIVIETLDRDILPLLSTFPTRPENLDQSRLFNQIAVQVAADYGLPLLNLNRALSALPNAGVNPADTIHLSVPPDQRVDVFDETHLQYGFTVRNLVTLQALQAVLTQ